MNSKRVYFLTLGLIGLLLVGLVAGTFGANNLLQAKSAKLKDLKLNSEVLANQQRQLTKAKQDVAKYGSLEHIAQTIVPQDKDQAEAVREIANLASDSGIGQLSSITFPASTLGGSLRSSTTSTSSSSNSSSAANSKKNALTQLTPVPGIKGVYNLQITVSQTADKPIPYEEFTTFLSKLEQNRRTAQVVSLSLTPNTKNPDLVSFELVINEFIKP